MAWMQVLGNCYACGVLFSFNAEWVPSIPVDGVRQPVCKDCIARANRIRRANGQESIWVHPDAYEPQEVP